MAPLPVGVQGAEAGSDPEPDQAGDRETRFTVYQMMTARGEES